MADPGLGQKTFSGGLAMYAVISTGGKQYRVEEGNTVRVEKLPGELGDTFSFDSVLLFSDGENIQIGKPNLENVRVHCRIVEQDKQRKILVFKFKRRKRFRKKAGHRQPYTALKVDRIETGQTAPAAQA
jgi:large subunit ribosomal protein L21